MQCVPAGGRGLRRAAATAPPLPVPFSKPRAEAAMPDMFSPCRLGPLSLRNHIVFLPFYTAYADEQGLVTPQLVSHYTRLAASGVGLVVVEAALVRDRLAGPYAIRAYGEERLPGLKKLAKAIQDQGAKAVLQVCHPGRFAYAPGCLAPSEVPAFGNPEFMPRAMAEEDMKEVMAAFAEAADISRRAGFDGVELHGGTGYLLASFTSPYSNRRTDSYGGSLENRARFPVRVCRAVRDKVGDFPVGYRFMAREYINGGLSLDEGVALAALIARELKPAYLSVTAGMHECFAMLAEHKEPAPEGFMLPEAQAVKSALPDEAVICAGQLRSPAICQKALDEGMADAVGLGRVLFADSDWPGKACGKKSGDIRHCVQCMTCQTLISKGRPAWCSRWSKEEKKLFLADVPAERLSKPK